ncbi:MAG: hypothetical protein FJY75_10110, partial [Candidatus Eisenbacteria bacterium]|nr:hypothetical protein [Candidatus Eisenbacteria bacterium]
MRPDASLPARGDRGPDRCPGLPAPPARPRRGSPAARISRLGLPVLAALWLAAGATAQRIVVLDETEQGKPATRVDLTVGRGEGGLSIRIGSDSLAAGESDSGRAGEVYESRVLRPGRHTSSDKVVFGQDLHIEADRVVSGDAVAIFGSVRVDGVVNGDVVSIGGGVTLADGAIVHGDCVAIGGGSIRTGAGSRIHGEAVTVGGRIIEEDGAHIADRVQMNFVPSFVGRPKLFIRAGWWVLFAHVLFVGILGFLMARLSGRRWSAASLTLRARPLESLLAGLGAGIVYGILGLPLLVVIMIALVAIVVGIPLVPLVVFLILFFPVPGYLVTGALLGGAARRRGAASGESAPADVGRDYFLGHLLLSSPWLLAVILRSLLGAWFGVAGLVLLFAWTVLWLAVAFGWGAFLLSRFGKRLPAASAEPGSAPG